MLRHPASFNKHEQRNHSFIRALKLGTKSIEVVDNGDKCL